MTTMAATRTRARQLDIIADTVLAADPRLAPVHSGSSSVAAKAGNGVVHSGSSSVDTRITAVERRRVTAGMSHSALCLAAGIEANNWHKLRRGTHRPSDLTLRKLNAALDAPRQAKPAQIVAGFHRLVMQLIALEMKFDVNTLLATDFSVQRPSNPQWLRAARIRQMAIYITTVELQLSNADLGRALGDTRANIKFARDAIEDRREDGNEIDLALSAVSLQVRAG